jgi:hypothetical protein
MAGTTSPVSRYRCRLPLIEATTAAPPQGLPNAEGIARVMAEHLPCPRVVGRSAESGAVEGRLGIGTSIIPPLVLRV